MNRLELLRTMKRIENIANEPSSTIKQLYTQIEEIRKLANHAVTDKK